jgi:hypothetical protein
VNGSLMTAWAPHPVPFFLASGPRSDRGNEFEPRAFDRTGLRPAEPTIVNRRDSARTRSRAVRLPAAEKEGRDPAATGKCGPKALNGRCRVSIPRVPVESAASISKQHLCAVARDCQNRQYTGEGAPVVSGERAHAIPTMSAAFPRTRYRANRARRRDRQRLSSRHEASGVTSHGKSSGRSGQVGTQTNLYS